MQACEQNRAAYHKCFVLPCHVQMGEDGCTADELIKKWIY